MIGITSWIRSDVLRHTRFRRPSAPRASSGATGLTLGRQVDRLFKEWCETGAVGAGRFPATSRLRHVISAMRTAGLRPVGANVLVSMNGIRTHLDGLAVDRAGRKVVVELKSTGATSAAHSVVYRAPCVNRPMTRFGANTEELHHRLQTSFGVAAHGAAAYGVVLVACSNKAMLYTVPAGAFPASAFRAAATAVSAVASTSWPSAAAAGTVGGAAVRSRCGRWARVTTTGGTAVALSGAPLSVPASELAAAKALLATRPRPRHLVYPLGGRWRRQCVP